MTGLRVATGVVFAVGALVGLTGCVDVGIATQEVRPLVTSTAGNFTVVARDDASVHDMLLRAGDAIVIVADGQPWNTLSNNDLNEEIIEVTFVGRDRSPNRYGGGTEATSTVIRKNTAVLSMSGDEGACWGLRMTRTDAGARLQYTSIFSPECTADELLASTVVWADTWPERAVPDADFVPPPPPDENLPGGLTPDDLLPDTQQPEQGNPSPTTTPSPEPAGS